MKVDLTENELLVLQMCLHSYVPMLENTLKEVQRQKKPSKQIMADMNRRIAALKGVHSKALAVLAAAKESEIESDVSDVPDPIGEDRPSELAIAAIKLIGKRQFTIHSVVSTAIPETVEGFKDLKRVVEMAYKRGFKAAGGEGCQSNPLSSTSKNTTEAKQSCGK